MVPAAADGWGTTDVALLLGMAADGGGTVAHISTFVGGTTTCASDVGVWEHQCVSQQRGKLLVRQLERNIVCMMKKLHSQHAVDC